MKKFVKDFVFEIPHQASELLRYLNHIIYFSKLCLAKLLVTFTMWHRSHHNTDDDTHIDTLSLSCILTIVTCISLFSEYFQLRVKIKCYYIEICYGVRWKSISKDTDIKEAINSYCHPIICWMCMMIYDSI